MRIFNKQLINLEYTQKQKLTFFMYPYLNDSTWNITINHFTIFLLAVKLLVSKNICKFTMIDD